MIRVANTGEERPSPLPSNPDLEGGHMLDPDVMIAIRWLPPYLQLVVMLMVNIVPPSEEDKLWDKRGKEALA